MRRLVMLFLSGAVLLGACQQSPPARTSGSSGDSEQQRLLPEGKQNTGSPDKDNDAQVQQKQEENQVQQLQGRQNQSRSEEGRFGSSKGSDDSSGQTNSELELGQNENTKTPETVDVPPDDIKGVKIRRKRLRAARKKLKELSRKENKHTWPEKFDRRAINRLEKYMSDRGWSNFRFDHASRRQTNDDQETSEP